MSNLVDERSAVTLPSASPWSRLRPPGWLEEALLAAAGGILAWMVSCWLEPARATPHGFGLQWREMSEQPFAFLGQLPHRMLTPLLAHLVGLTGDSFTDFTRVSGAVMLALAFFVCRKRGALRRDAMLITIAIALTGAIQIYKRGMIGYCDNVSFSLFLLGWLNRRRGFVFWPLFFFNLVNHDMAAFFLPWMWFLRREVGALRRYDAIGAGLVLFCYYLFRLYVAKHAASWEYDEGYFLANCFLPFHFVWIWFLAACHLLLQFGPMLTVLLWQLWQERPERERMGTALMLLGLGGVFCFAYDVHRHSNLIFLPIVLASTRFLVDWRSRAAYIALTLLTALNYFLFSWRPEGEDPWNFQSPGWLFDWITGILVMQNGGHRLILPQHRFDLSVQWDVLTTSLPLLKNEMIGFAFGALWIVAASRWLWRKNIGGPRWAA
jgi:hypothetical protein